jgi:hypothetical protein
MAIESAHKIISVTLLATGRLIMATEKRMYELVADVWTPMKFADDPPPPAAHDAPPTGAATKPVPGSIFAPPSKV